MAKLSGPDEVEYKRLQAELTQVERLLASGLNASLAAVPLQAYASQTKQRLESLEAKAEKQEHERQEVEARAQAASLAARETELSKREQEQYRQFLEKDYFTKADFGALEGFYSNTYDRLSEGGKDQMSQRVWGGVKRGEYEFTELPDVVKEKEAARLEQILKKGPSQSSNVWWVPEADREDFSKAREAGRREESYKVLNRPSFSAALGSCETQQVSAESVQLANKENRQITASGGIAGKAVTEKAQEADQGAVSMEDLGTFAAPSSKAIAGNSSLDIPKPPVGRR